MVTKDKIEVFIKGVVMDFDGSNAVKPEGKFKKIPNGWYKGIITSAERKVSKSGVYHMVKCEYKIMDEGEFKNRLLADHFCIAINDDSLIIDKSKADTALQIGRYNFTELLVLAIGTKKISLDNLYELFGKKLSLYVESKEDDKYTAIKGKAEFSFDAPEQPKVINHAPSNFEPEPEFNNQEEMPF